MYHRAPCPGDDFWSPFQAGVTKPFSDPSLKALLEKSGVHLVTPTQYMDKWRLDKSGIRAIPNTAVKKALGFER